MLGAEANGYGTVAVDLAAEQATLKALRKAQMDRPPSVATSCPPSTFIKLTFMLILGIWQAGSDEEEPGDGGDGGVPLGCAEG